MLRKNRVLTALGLVGFIAGLFLFRFLKKGLYGENGIFNTELLCALKYSAVDCSAFFWYVLFDRLRLVLILVILSTTWLGIVGAYCCAAWLGFSMSVLILDAISSYGLKGILLVLAGIFPQIIIYFPLILFFLRWSYDFCQFLYHEVPKGFTRNEMIRKKGIQVFMALPVLVLGCFLESYVNPYIVLGLLKIF